MRAVAAASGNRSSSNGGAARDAAPFADVWLDHAEMPGIDGSIERLKTQQVLAAGQRNARKHGKLRPMLWRFVGRYRLLDPVQRELTERLDRRTSRCKIPALIGVDHEALARLQTNGDVAHIPQI